VVALVDRMVLVKEMVAVGVGVEAMCGTRTAVDHAILQEEEEVVEEEAEATMHEALTKLLL